MSHRRSLAVAGVVSGCLVVAGGYCDGHRLSSAEAYTGTGWTPLPPMPHAASSATACVLNGRLYVIGGRHNNKLQVLEMTAETGLYWSRKWFRKADLPANRAAAASVVHEGRIWVMGGEVGEENEPSASVITYDPVTDEWEMGPPLPSPQIGCTAVTIDGGILFAGCAGNANTNGKRIKSLFKYENVAWSRVQLDARPARPERCPWDLGHRDLAHAPRFPTCASVLLG